MLLLFFTYTDAVVTGATVVVSRRITALFAATNTRSLRQGRKIIIQTSQHTSQQQQLKRSQLLAVKKTAFQDKLDFIGSLDNAYDLNPENRVSTSFLHKLVEQQQQQSSSSRDTKLILESSVVGKWRLVYVEECSTLFGFGSLFHIGGRRGSASSSQPSSVTVELEKDGTIACNIQWNDATTSYSTHNNNMPSNQLNIEGRYGIASHNIMINVNDVHYTQQTTSQSESIINKINNNNRLSSSSSKLKKNKAQQQQQQQQRTNKEGISSIIRNKILANNWKQIFAGIIVINIEYIDNNLIIFDIDLLARLKGIRLCIRKEPDYF
jgi:hypothetical protein